MTVAFDDHVDNLAHVLIGVAANALPQNALHLAIVDDGCRGPVLSDGGSLWLGFCRAGRLICRWGLARTSWERKARLSQEVQRAQSRSLPWLEKDYA